MALPWLGLAPTPAYPKGTPEAQKLFAKASEAPETPGFCSRQSWNPEALNPEALNPKGPKPQTTSGPGRSAGVNALGLRVEGLRLRVEGLGLRVEG